MSSSAAASPAPPESPAVPPGVPPGVAPGLAAAPPGEPVAIGPAEPAATEAPAAEASRPAAVLKGGPRGLEFLIDGRAKVDAIAAALCTRLAEAPGFFRGSSVRVRVEDGPLPAGCLARLDDIATRFELRILEVGAAKAAKADGDSAAQPSLATGSTAVPAGSTASGSEPIAAPTLDGATTAAAPTAAPAAAPASVQTVAPAPAPAVAPTAAGEDSSAALAAAAAALPEGDTRIVVGPVRSGVILEHHGNLIVIGDVNPGAEVRAERNIIVLGRLRGIAHAGIGRTYGFILALALEPQQLRIARQVARAADADGPVASAEIAYVTSNKIVVERYAGKLPLGLANSM